MELRGSQMLLSGLKFEFITAILLLAVLCNSIPAEPHDERPPPARMLHSDRDNPGFVSIDCGAPTSYYDEQLGLLYRTDAGFVDTGINRQISPRYTKEKQLKNLRSFPNGTRNCYTLRPPNGKNHRYLIRASFVYGNYDGRNETPVFDLHLGVDKWLSVIINDPSVRYDHGINYVPSADHIDLCLVNTGFGVPFISVVELRPLETAMYPTQFRSLRILERLYFGKTMIRYPDDVYDRLWRPTRHFPDSFPVTSNLSISHEQSLKDSNKLPDEVLTSAVQSRNASTALKYAWNNKNSTSKWIFCLYINEIEKREQERQREMVVNINNEFRESLTLEYLKPVTIVSPSPMTGATINFSLSAKGNSGLPPILNAFEILQVMEFTSGTAEDDVYAVKHVKNVYGVTRQSWQGDPCAPHDYLWEGLRCSYTGPPRIIALNLRSSNLTGQIASSIAKLTAIEHLDLSYNQLTGALPEFLAELPRLKILNLTGNNLSGPVPDALLEKYRLRKLQMSLEENPSLCPSDVCQASVQEERHKSNQKQVVALAASIVSAFVLILFGAAVVFWRVKRKKQEAYTTMTSSHGDIRNRAVRGYSAGHQLK